jgi:hypothetical protein
MPSACTTGQTGHVGGFKQMTDTRNVTGVGSLLRNMQDQSSGGIVLLTSGIFVVREDFFGRDFQRIHGKGGAAGTAQPWAKGEAVIGPRSTAAPGLERSSRRCQRAGAEAAPRWVADVSPRCEEAGFLQRHITDRVELVDRAAPQQEL